MRAMMVRTFAVLLSVLMTAGVVGPAPAGAAQDAPGVTSFSSYESPTFGYEVDWAGAMGLWEVVPEGTITGDGLDLLTLGSPISAQLQIFGVDPGLDPERVLGSLMDGTLDDHPDAEVVEEAGGAAPAVTVEFQLDGVPTRNRIEARVLESGTALVAVSLTTPAELFETNLEVAQEDVDLDGEPLFAGLATDPGDEPERDDEPDRDENDNRDRDPDEDEDDDRPSRRSSDETYESVVYGYTLSYDADTWEIAFQNDDPSASYDYAIFSNGVSVLTVAGDPSFDDGDLDGCLDDDLDELEESETVSDIEPWDGRSADGEDDDRAWATYAYDDGSAGESVRYTECRWLGDGLTLVIIHWAPADAYEDEIAAREELLEGIAPAGTAPADDRDRDEDNEDDDRRTSGEVYESPNYGFTLAYDPGNWEIASEDDDPSDPYDRVMLSNGTSVVVVTGDPDYDADDMEGCLDDYSATLENDDNVSDVEPLDERGAAGEDDDRAWATYAYSDDNVGDAVRYYECRWLGDGVTLVVIHVAPADEYEDEIEAREDLLAGLEPSPAEGLG